MADQKNKALNQLRDLWQSYPQRIHIRELKTSINVPFNATRVIVSPSWRVVTKWNEHAYPVGGGPWTSIQRNLWLDEKVDTRAMKPDDVDRWLYSKANVCNIVLPLSHQPLLCAVGGSVDAHLLPYKIEFDQWNITPSTSMWNDTSEWALGSISSSFFLVRSFRV